MKVRYHFRNLKRVRLWTCLTYDDNSFINTVTTAIWPVLCRKRLSPLPWCNTFCYLLTVQKYSQLQDILLKVLLFLFYHFLKKNLKTNTTTIAIHLISFAHVYTFPGKLIIQNFVVWSSWHYNRTSLTTDISDIGVRFQIIERFTGFSS